VGPLLKFFSLTYLVTWSCFIAFGALSRGTSARPAVAALGGLVLLVGVFAPSLVALWLTTAADGRSGMLALLGRLFQWQVDARWYVFAAGYTAAVKLTVALVYRLATGAWPRFGHEAWYLMIVATVFSTPVQAGEEIGWRGYVLPRLATRFGLGRASVVLGVIWACWHLPLFFIPVSDTYGQSFAVYLLQVTAMSVAMAWLYGHTKGSLLLVMLLHAAVNNTKDIVPSAVPMPGHVFTLSSSPVAWISVLLFWICAAYFLARMPKLEPQPAAARGPACAT
jgi:uncharacterized protein